MTVIRPNSISGINSITAQTSAINFYDSAGATLSIGASFTGNLTGNVTGNVTGDVTGNLTGDINAGIITATTITGVSTIGVTTVTATNLTVNGNAYPTAGPLSNRNLIINGAMRVAQRGTSSTSSGFYTVDRFTAYHSGGTKTQSQGSITSGEPYNAGFRNIFRVTNTTAGSATAAEYILQDYTIEAQDLANSGWDCTSSSSYITLSFWIRTSVAGTYYGYLKTDDGTAQRYAYSTGALEANTWTKVTKTIPGNSNVTIDNNNGEGLRIYLPSPYLGTNYTDSGVSVDTWGSYASGTRTPDFSSSTWQTTTNATWDITGVQLEVGEVATPFEHRSYGDELARCQRYYYKVGGVANPISNGDTFGVGIAIDVDFGRPVIVFPVTMRGDVTAVETTGTASDYLVAYKNQEAVCGFAPSFSAGSATSARITFALSTSPMTQGHAMEGRANNSNAYLGFSAEL